MWSVTMLSACCAECHFNFINLNAVVISIYAECRFAFLTGVRRK
jgi:hypothetical protein